jgi:hypothetical protein
LQLRETPSGGRDKGRDAGRSVKGQWNAFAASAASNVGNAEQGAQQNAGDQSVVSEIMDGGSQKGRNFGCGAYWHEAGAGNDCGAMPMILS